MINLHLPLIFVAVANTGTHMGKTDVPGITLDSSIAMFQDDHPRSTTLQSARHTPLTRGPSCGRVSIAPWLKEESSWKPDLALAHSGSTPRCSPGGLPLGQLEVAGCTQGGSELPRPAMLAHGGQHQHRHDHGHDHRAAQARVHLCPGSIPGRPWLKNSHHQTAMERRQVHEAWF